MAIEFRCKGCDELLRVGDRTAGVQVRCPACGKLTRVPAVDAPGPSHDPRPAWERDAAVGRQTALGSPFSAAPPAESENPYQSPAALEAWDGGEVYAPDDQDYELAGRGTRLGGYFLDVLFYVVGAVPGFIVAMAFADAGNQDAEMGAMLLMAGGIVLVAIVNWVMITQSGQSIAKRLLGMRIVRVDDGALPGFVRGVILRVWIPAVINQFCSLFGLIDALWIFGEERRCLHDQIAMTRVVVARSSPDPVRCANCGRTVSSKTFKCRDCGAGVDGVPLGYGK